MKKLFYLGMIAGILFTVSSCSKSAGDLSSNEKTMETNLAQQGKKSPQTGNPNLSPITSLDLTDIYHFINQPEVMELGLDDGSTIIAGQMAVFYVLLSPELADVQIESATLTTINEADGQPISTYNLISYRDVGTMDAQVPDELLDKPFMVAMVYLGDQYIDKMINLSSYIAFNGVFSAAQLDRAFIVSQ